MEHGAGGVGRDAAEVHTGFSESGVIAYGKLKAFARCVHWILAEAGVVVDEVLRADDMLGFRNGRHNDESEQRAGRE